MTENDNRIDARDWSLLGLLSVLWGGSFFFNGVVLRELPPLTVVLLRVALAAMILLPVLWAYRIRFPVGLSGWRPFFAIALLNNVFFDRHRTDLYPQRTGLDPERNHALVHRSRDGCRRRRETAPAPCRGRRHGVDRRDHSPWARPSWTRSGHSGRGGDRHPALPRRGLQLWISRTLCAAQTVGLAAACDGDVSIAGVQSDDDDHRGRGRTSLAIADAGRNDMAGDDGPRRIVDCAGLYRIFSGVAALGLDQRHAGDASHSGDGYSARLSRAGRKHLAARDRRRPRDRQRAAADRRARAQFRPTRARNSIAPSPTTRARPRPQGREPPLRADAIVRRCGRPSYRNPSGSCVPSCRRWSQRRPSVLYRPVDLRGSLFPCSPHPDDTCRPRLRAGWTSCREARSASPKIFPRHQSQTRHNAGLCLGR